MGGSRSYSVSSTCSVGSNSSGNYSECSTAGSEQTNQALVTNVVIYSPQCGEAGGGEAGNESVAEDRLMRHEDEQPTQQRVWSPPRIICRCCLSEKLAPKTLDSSSDQERDADEEAPLLVFVPLDTLAMVDLSEDKHASDQQSSGDSYKAADASARPTAANRAGRRNGITKTATTKAAAMNNKKVNSTLLDCLNACARIGASLEDIELPQHICLDCCHTLEMCCEFIRCVRNADKILRRRCALPTKRFSQQQQQQQQQQHQALIVGSGAYVEEEEDEADEEQQQQSPVAKRRRRREERVQQEHRLSVTRAGLNEKSLVNNTPKSISLSGAASTAVAAAKATAPQTSAEKDQLLDISMEPDGVDALMRSFDSGIEYDEDLSSVKSSDASSANENTLNYHLAKYEGYTYVVAETLSHDLERFHRSDRKQAGTGGGGGVTSSTVTYKCGFCIFECTVRQELNKHLQIHLGPPQHSCRKCNFVGHFKFLLAQHMRNVHHCQLEAIGKTQEAGGAATESPKYHCHLCEEYFVNYDALQQHRKSHKVFCKCTICTFKSSTRENILEHMAKEHKVLVERRLMVKYIPLQRTNVEQSQELSPTKNKTQFNETKPLLKDKKYRTHLCQFCGKCFERRFHLLKHEYGVHRDEIEQNNSVDALTQTKLSATITSTKNTKLKYLRQRNAVQEARQQRCAEELELLDNRKADKDMTSKFKCVICSAVFMFNFELKYHMRTHKPGPNPQTSKLGWHKEPAYRRNTSTPTLPKATSLAADVVESEIKLTAVLPKEYETEPIVEVASAEGVNDMNAAGNVHIDHYYYYYNGEADAVTDPVDEVIDDIPPFTHPDSPIAIETCLPTLIDDVDLDLMSLVAPQISPLATVDASPTSSNNSFDVNYDDQLYLNDFDLGLLDCSGGF